MTINLAVGVPAYGMTVDAEHCTMWLLLGHALCANEETFKFLGLQTVSMNPVADARNMLVQSGLEVYADWLLMCDADTYYHGPADLGGIHILQMIKDAQNQGAAVVGAPVHARGWANHARTVWMVDERSQIALNPLERRMSVADEKSYLGKLVPCARIGAAFLAVNLHWIREYMPSPGPWFVHEPCMVGPPQSRLRAHGEDTVFCDMVRARGGTILVDGRILPEHVMDPERI